MIQLLRHWGAEDSELDDDIETQARKAAARGDTETV